VLLAAAVVARADDKPKDPPKDDSPKTAAEQYQALVKEFEDAAREFNTKYRAAETPEEKQKLLKERPNVSDYAKKFLELAKKHPQDSAALDALVWICTYTPRGAEGKEAMEIVFKDHIKSENIGALIDRLAPGSDTEKTLRRLVAESPHTDVKGLAAFRLGQLLKDNKAESEKLFEEVIAKFPDVKRYGGTIGKMAKGELNELHGKLELGKPAMAIEAEDIDGTKFKLSDYRGKVVMLDFWGHW